MEFKEVRKRKRRLELEIQKLIKEFQNETEVTVNEVGYTRLFDWSGETSGVIVHVGIEI